MATDPHEKFQNEIPKVFMKDVVVIYGADERRKQSIWQSYVTMWSNFLGSKHLIFQLFKRDFFAVYKKSFLGVGWVLISPLIGVASWIVMSMTGILNPGDTGVPYPVYVLISTSIWGLFIGFYSAGESTLTTGASFILQVKYPHEVLLIKQTAQHLANFLISFLINILVILAFHIFPSWKIIFFPLMVLPLFFLGAGLGLTMSVISVVSVEFQKGFNIILGMLIYITPIIYTADVKNETLRKVIAWNPLTYLVSGVRDVILYGNLNNGTEFFVSSALSFLIFIFSLRLFFVSEEKVIEKMI